jgi:hypothetical protein
VQSDTHLPGYGTSTARSDTLRYRWLNVAFIIRETYYSENIIIKCGGTIYCLHAMKKTLSNCTAIQLIVLCAVVVTDN